jgi:hypothetical protein
MKFFTSLTRYSLVTKFTSSRLPLLDTECLANTDTHALSLCVPNGLI